MRKRTLELVVGGEPLTVRVGVDAPVSHVVAVALHRTGNIGQPPESWELRDVTGALFAPDRTVADLPPDRRFFISLHAGVGA